MSDLTPAELEKLRRLQRQAEIEGCIPNIPNDMSIPELAEQVVRGKIKLSPPQQRMLIELLPFYMPKLSAIGFVRNADTFAERLERALARSNGVRQRPKLLEDLRFKPPRGDDPRE